VVLAQLPGYAPDPKVRSLKMHLEFRVFYCVVMCLHEEQQAGQLLMVLAQLPGYAADTEGRDMRSFFIVMSTGSCWWRCNSYALNVRQPAVGAVEVQEPLHCSMRQRALAAAVRDTFNSHVCLCLLLCYCLPWLSAGGPGLVRSQPGPSSGSHTAAAAAADDCSTGAGGRGQARAAATATAGAAGVSAGGWLTDH
jgi:hypothetical protein